MSSGNMKIKNMGIRNIEARRLVKDLSKPMNIRIDHNSSLKVFSYAGNNEAQVEFEYIASYGPIGFIKFEGELVFVSDDAEELAKQWQTKKNMPDNVASHVHTSLMHFCLPEAVMIARDLKLPPPIPLPQVRFDKQDSGKQNKKSYNPEFA